MKGQGTKGGPSSAEGWSKKNIEKDDLADLGIGLTRALALSQDGVLETPSQA